MSGQACVIVYVSGGVVQGARADGAVGFEVFDADNERAKGKSDDEIEGEWREIAKEFPEAVY